MTGTTRVEDAALRLHDMSGRDAVVTDGGRGAIVADNASVRRIPGFPVAIVDTIGSGDAHTGGVIAGLMCGLPIDECVLLANRVASVVTAARAAPARPRSTSSSPSTADVQGPSFPFKSTAPPGLPLGRTGNFIPSSRKDNQHERQLLRLRH